MKTVKISSLLLVCIITAGAVFAQDARLPVRAVSSEAEKEEILLDTSAMSAVYKSVERPKLFLNIADSGIKKRWDPPKMKVKTVFKPEVGLVEIAGIPSETGGIGLNIKDCVSIAEKNSLQLQIANKNTALARMRLWEARRNMLPSAAITYQEYSGQIYGRKYMGRKQYIEGQQPVFHGGELYYTAKQAEANLEITKNEYNKVRNELVLQVKKAYYSLSKSKENTKIQLALSKEVARIYDMISRQIESGIASKLEFLNVSSQASQARYQLTSAEGDEAIAELILKQAMNVDMQDIINIEAAPEFKKISIDFDKVLMDALNNRPDIKINILMVDYYKFGRNVAKGKLWPKIDIMGNWGLAKEEYVSSDLGTDQDQKLEQQWYAGIKGSMPFWGSTGEYSYTREQWTPVVSAYQGTEATTNSVSFKILDALNKYSDKQAALIDFDRARQELNKIKQDISIEVREGYFNYEKAALQMETASGKVKYQEGDLELVKLKRSMDEAQDSNVIESMIKLGQEKFGYLQALSDCHTSVAALNKAVGVDGYMERMDEDAGKR